MPLKDWETTLALYPLLSEDEERALAERIEQGDKDAVQKMALCNLRLVIDEVLKVERMHPNMSLSFDDLMAEGNLALMAAVQRYRLDRGNRFYSYAVRLIQFALQGALSASSRGMGVPPRLSSLASHWKKAVTDMTQELSRTPTQSEIAERLHISEEEAECVQMVLHIDNIVSIDLPSTSTDGQYVASGELMTQGEREELIHMLDDKNYIGKMRHYAMSAERKLNILLDCLPERECRILRMRYAIGEEYQTPMTLEAIAMTFFPPITKERVRQLELQALKYLIHVLASTTVHAEKKIKKE